MAATEQDVIDKLEEVNQNFLEVTGLVTQMGEHSAAIQNLSDTISSIQIAQTAIEEPIPMLTLIKDSLSVIEAECTGSWMLDKATGILTLFDLNGDVLAKFHMEDTETYAHKERRTDLE